MEKENANVKKSKKGLIIGIAVALAIIVAGVAAGIYYYTSTNYVGKVSDQKITKQEYQLFSKFNMSQFLSGANTTTTADKYDWSTKTNDKTAKDQVVTTTLDNIQEMKIQLIKAKEAGVVLEKTDLDTIDQNIESQISQSGSRAEAEKSFKTEYGITLSEYKEIYKELMLTQKYMSQEIKNAKITDDEIKKYYDENKTDYDKVTATHILISTVDSNGASLSEGKKAEAKKKAEDLLAKVKAGEDISKLAQENSADPSVSENKGTLTFGKGEMVTEFEDFCFNNKVGDVGLVETQFGYHVIKIQEHKEQTLDEVKDTIKSTLGYNKYNEKLEAWKKEAQFAVVKNDKVLDKLNKSLYRI